MSSLAKPQSLAAREAIIATETHTPDVIGVTHAGFALSHASRAGLGKSGLPRERVW